MLLPLMWGHAPYHYDWHAVCACLCGALTAKAPTQRFGPDWQELDTFGRDREIRVADLPGLPYLDAVFKESLRLLPPGHITARQATEDLMLGNTFIPKSTWIHVR